MPNEVWQMDVTHFSEFGCLSYLHVSIDIYSHLLWASAHPGETSTIHIQCHLLATFAHMSIPKKLKTDNGPTYTRKAFKTFCSLWSISHPTGIPYNPTGQAIIEQAQYALKNQLSKQKGGKAGKSPPARLHLALLTFNFFTTDDQKSTPYEKHHSHAPSVQHPQIWRKVPEGGPWEGPTPPTNLGMRIWLCLNRSRPLLDTKQVPQAIPWTPPTICNRGDVESHSEHSDSDTESPEDMPGGAPK